MKRFFIREKEEENFYRFLSVYSQVQVKISIKNLSFFRGFLLVINNNFCKHASKEYSV